MIFYIKLIRRMCYSAKRFLQIINNVADTYMAFKTYHMASWLSGLWWLWLVLSVVWRLSAPLPLLTLSMQVNERGKLQKTYFPVKTARGKKQVCLMSAILFLITATLTVASVSWEAYNIIVMHQFEPGMPQLNSTYNDNIQNFVTNQFQGAAKTLKKTFLS